MEALTFKSWGRVYKIEPGEHEWVLITDDCGVVIEMPRDALNVMSRYVQACYDVAYLKGIFEIEAQGEGDQKEAQG